MNSPKSKQNCRQAMKNLDIRQFFHRQQNEVNKRHHSEEEVTESESKRLKMDKDSDQPQRPVAEITIVNDDLPVFVTPSPKDEDFSSVPFSEFDLVQRDKNPQNSLAILECPALMEVSIKLEAQNKEFFKFLEFSNANTSIIPIQRLDSTKLFTSKIKKTLNMLKKKAKKYYKEEFEVETILDYKWDRKEKEGKYEIKWTGYEELTWEPIENIISCQKALEEFYLRRTSQRESARPSEKRKMEVPPDPKTLFEKKQDFLVEICPPPDQTQLQEFFSQYRVKKIKSWSDIKFKDIVNKYKRDVVPPKLREEIREQMMIKYLMAKRKDQLSRLKEWETEINMTSSEPAPLKIENNVDFEGPPRHMTYIGENMIGNGVVFNDDPPMWCECDEGECELKREKNCCPGNHNQNFPYTKFGKLRVPLGTPIFECNKKCKCGPTCSNRVVQRGRRIKLCIFRTSNGCGWGVKTLEPIKKGSFVVEYVGEVILSEEAERRGKTYDTNGITYLFDVDFHDSENLYTIDAAFYGNVAHFINHSCNPNLAIFSVWVNNLDPNLPKLCFYAMRDIEKGEQITFDYSQKIDDGERHGEDEAKGLTNCKCDAPNCRKMFDQASPDRSLTLNNANRDAFECIKIIPFGGFKQNNISRLRSGIRITCW